MGQPRPSGAVTTGYVLVSVLLILAAVVYPAFQIVEYGRMLSGSATLDVDAQVNPERIDVGEDVHLKGWPEVVLEVEDPTTGQVLLSTAEDVGPWLLSVAGLWLLWGLARSVRKGDPFGPQNVKRLRGLGFLLVVGAPLVELFNSAIRASMLNSLPPDRFGDFGMAGFALPATAMVAGLGAFILAEVFAYGLRLREDVEATV